MKHYKLLSRQYRLTLQPVIAPVCLIVIIVDAGAVALASALNTKEKGKDKCKIKYVRIKIKMDANKDSKIVIIIVLLPFFFNTSNRKNSPVLNAINAKAISEINSIPVITDVGINRKQKGPIMIPARIYAVTLGSLKSLVTLVNANPINSIRATEMTTLATGDI